MRAAPLTLPVSPAPFEAFASLDNTIAVQQRIAVQLPRA
jgi:hypothetical protein